MVGDLLDGRKIDMPEPRRWLRTSRTSVPEEHQGTTRYSDNGSIFRSYSPLCHTRSPLTATRPTTQPLRRHVGERGRLCAERVRRRRWLACRGSFRLLCDGRSRRALSWKDDSRKVM